jgi:hypothetical protein
MTIYATAVIKNYQAATEYEIDQEFESLEAIEAEKLESESFADQLEGNVDPALTIVEREADDEPGAWWLYDRSSEDVAVIAPAIEDSVALSEFKKIYRIAVEELINNNDSSDQKIWDGEILTGDARNRAEDDAFNPVYQQEHGFKHCTIHHFESLGVVFSEGCEDITNTQVEIEKSLN